MKSLKFITLIFIASFTLSGCASNSLCKSAYDVVEGTFDNYNDRQERARKDLSRPNADKFNDQDLAAGILNAGIRGIAGLFESNSKANTRSNSFSSECPRT
ncbi:hypothetical protein [Alteromonas sp. BMJM2]|uniref:hypothetical protein n=1 Tax=Alteromonas sp. BMJM2 TaxID=2954241 RepID=UPI0022B55BE2|nr:hypothetical protein [Alteromonas sp. BMJM2]